MRKQPKGRPREKPRAPSAKVPPRGFHAFAISLEHRVEAHIFVAFLAYCLHVTLRAQLKPLAPGLTPGAVLDKLAAIQMLDGTLPDPDARTLILSLYTELNAIRRQAALCYGVCQRDQASEAPHGSRPNVIGASCRCLSGSARCDVSSSLEMATIVLNTNLCRHCWHVLCRKSFELRTSCSLSWIASNLPRNILITRR
jgi:hypothetical protein